MHVELVETFGSELSIINAARISFGRSKKDLDESDIGLIGYLMRNRHATPFEQAGFSVKVTCPIFVSREWFRHRVGKYNEFSTRYAKNKNKPFSYHIPHPEEFRAQVGKPGHYTFEKVDVEVALNGIQIMENIFSLCDQAYKQLEELGIAREVCRNVLPLATMTEFVCYFDLRGWFNFLSLRTTDQALREIRELAIECEGIVAQHFPHAHAAWDDNGRGPL